jgi:hypothetical protein
MNKPDQVDQGKPRPKPPRSEEALRIIEEYVNDLREIIKKLRQRRHQTRPDPQRREYPP